MSGFVDEFKTFAVKGNMVDLAVGIIIGGAFGTIVKSLVDDVIMPPIGLVLGNVDFTDLYLLLRSGTPAGPYTTLADAQAAGAVTLNYGRFGNNVVSFLIVALAVFLIVRAINRLRGDSVAEPEAPSLKDCQYCRRAIPIDASRCPECTSELVAR